jgi:hypothetical protein
MGGRPIHLFARFRFWEVPDFSAMAYDPTLPQEGTEIDAVEMRSQLNCLKDLIDAISTITAAEIDSVTTGAPGSPATVGLSVVGNTLHFTFGLPQGTAGSNGLPGSNGSNGTNGTNGAPGPTGPPFAAAEIDGVSMLKPGNPATVESTFDGTAVHFSFGIPRGNDGGAGVEGPPGEVSENDLFSAISGTSNNSNSVAQIGGTATSEYDPAQMQEVLNKVDELIGALRRYVFSW